MVEIVPSQRVEYFATVLFRTSDYFTVSLFSSILCVFICFSQQFCFGEYNFCQKPNFLMGFTIYWFIYIFFLFKYFLEHLFWHVFSETSFFSDTCFLEHMFSESVFYLFLKQVQEHQWSNCNNRLLYCFMFRLTSNCAWRRLSWIKVKAVQMNVYFLVVNFLILLCANSAVFFFNVVFFNVLYCLPQTQKGKKKKTTENNNDSSLKKTSILQRTKWKKDERSYIKIAKFKTN